MQVSRIQGLLSGVPRRALDIPDFAVTAWAGHSAFAYDLVRFTRPKVLVELGTHGGYSYFSFCHAAKDFATGTQCHAVDTWQGDEQAGFYAAYIHALVQTYNSAHFADFSTLQKMTFDEAAARFAPGSIDVLHIDGLHTYEAVRHDWETWRPLVKAGGIVLFHDTAARKPGFGVWRLWEELAAAHPSFHFSHSSGLGVLCNGVVPAENAFLDLLFNGSVRERVALEWHYQMPSPLFTQLFWSWDGQFSEAQSQKAAWVSDDEALLRFEIPAEAARLHLRIDPLRMPGVLEIASLVVRHSADAAPLFSMPSAADAPAPMLSHDILKIAEVPVMKLLIVGGMPEIVLPAIRVPASDGITCEIRLRIRPGATAMAEAVREQMDKAGRGGPLRAFRCFQRRIASWIKGRAGRGSSAFCIEAPADFHRAPQTGTFTGWVFARCGEPYIAVRARIGLETWSGKYFEVREDVAAQNPGAGNATGFSIPYSVCAGHSCRVAFDAFTADGRWVQFASRVLACDPEQRQTVDC